MSRRALRLGGVAILLAAIVAGVAERDRFDADAARAWIESLGVFAPIAFLAAYSIAPALFVPGSVLTIAAGALFGVALGGLLSLVGATAGATLAFLIARHLSGDWIERRVSGRLQELRDGVEREGWRFVALVRLVPIFPFNLLNYALGLTRISVATYAGTSFVTMAPGAFAYAYVGEVGREAAAGEAGWVRGVLVAVGVVAALALLPSIVRRWRRPTTIDAAELRERLAGAEPPLVLDVRTVDEWNGELGHIDGALLVPLGELAARIGELAAHKSRLVVPV